MDFIDSFLSDIGLNIDSENININYKENYDNFTIVDGEEGDFGVIEYYGSDGYLLAAKEVFGGDDYNFKYTEKCKSILQEQIINILKNKINNLETINKLSNKTVRKRNKAI